MITLPNAKMPDGIVRATDSKHCFGHGSAAILAINSPQCRALISQQGAQLLQFRPVGGRQWLWLDNNNRYTNDQPINGGIPLCAPWFGQAAEAGLPMHGFLQSRPWQLEQVDCNGKAVLSCWRYDNPSDEPLFPHAFSIRQSITLGEDINLALSVTNHEKHSIPFSWAWHSYFALADPDACITGLERQSFLDNTDGLRQHYCSQPLVAGRCMDYVFEHQAGPQCLQQEPPMFVRGENCPTCIIWQPGTAGSNHFVCIERGNAFADSLQLPAGGSFNAAMTITQQPES